MTQQEILTQLRIGEFKPTKLYGKTVVLTKPSAIARFSMRYQYGS